MATAIEQFMRENGIRKLGLILADELLLRDRFTVELQDSWLGGHLGGGDSIEEALSDARQKQDVREAA